MYSIADIFPSLSIRHNEFPQQRGITEAELRLVNAQYIRTTLFQYRMRPRNTRRIYHRTSEKIHLIHTVQIVTKPVMTDLTERPPLVLLAEIIRSLSFQDS